MTTLKKLQRIAIVALFIMLFILSVYFVLNFCGLWEKLNSVSKFKSFILSLGFYGRSAFILFQFLQVTFIPIPSPILIIAGSIIYGPFQAGLLSLAGILLGSAFAFFLGKIFGQKIVRFMVGQEAQKKWTKFLNNCKFSFVLMMLLPCFPDDILCLVAGLTDMSWTFFMVTQFITRPIGIFSVSIFSSGFASSFGNLLIENKEKLKKSYEEYTYIYRTMAMWIYTSAAILIIPFISIYIKNDDGINYMLPLLGVLFAVSGLFRNIRIPSTTIIDATGMFNKRNIILNYFEVITNILLSLIFAFKYGLCGILMGCAVSSIIRSLIFIYDVDKKVMKKSYLKDFGLIVLNLMLGIVLYIIFDNIVVNGYIDWILEAIKVAFIGGILFFILNFILDYSSCKAFLQRVKRIVFKRS